LSSAVRLFFVNYKFILTSTINCFEFNEKFNKKIRIHLRILDDLNNVTCRDKQYQHIRELLRTFLFISEKHQRRKIRQTFRLKRTESYSIKWKDQDDNFVPSPKKVALNLLDIKERRRQKIKFYREFYKQLNNLNEEEKEELKMDFVSRNEFQEIQLTLANDVLPGAIPSTSKISLQKFWRETYCFATINQWRSTVVHHSSNFVKGKLDTLFVCHKSKEKRKYERRFLGKTLKIYDELFDLIDEQHLKWNHPDLLKMGYESKAPR
jgi:hypothetical protein